jgi:hypothetical protein
MHAGRVDDSDAPKKTSPTAGIRKRVSDSEWERWITLFREFPGEVVKVARLMGVPRNRSRIAWHHGWPKQHRPPICELLEADKMAARAKRADLEAQGVEDPVIEETPVSSLATESQRQVMAAMVERDKTRRKVLEDSSRTRAEEGALIAVTRRNTMALGAVTAQLMRGAQELAPKLAKALQTEAISIKDGMSIMQKLSVIARLGAEAGKMAVQMERLAMGEPMGDEAATAGGKLSPQDAERWLQLAIRTMQRSRDRTAATNARGGVDEDQGRSARAKPAAEAPSGDELDDDAGGVVEVGRTDLLN